MADYRTQLEEERLKLLEEQLEYLKFNKLDFYHPYAKQKEFHQALGGQNKAVTERLFMAANQSGKTYAGAMEVAYHLTGKYPKWWKGRRFERPNKWWVAGDSGETTRDNPQRLLLGDIGSWGEGTIPKDCIGKHLSARGTGGLVDHISIKHVSGGNSDLFFKFYGKGREKWQGATIDGLWFDEEPPADVYDEGLIRLKRNKGIALTTFTPLLGMSDVVMRFWQPNPDDPANDYRQLINMTIDDIAKEEHGHVTEDEVKAWIAGIPEHEREARTKGIPLLGSGKVFPMDPAEIRCDPFPIPKFWPRIMGIDFGWGEHPTAAVCIAIDPENKKLYMYDSYKSKETGIAYHAMYLRRKGHIPIAWPHDGLQKDKSSGLQVAQLYRDQGLWLISEHAQYPDKRKNGLEASVAEVYDLFKSGNLKVFTTLQDFWDEYGIFHRKDGRIVAVRDDTIAAMRYALMMRRYAEPYKEPPKERQKYDQTKKVRDTSWMSH